jgi:hypothetical protein
VQVNSHKVREIFMQANRMDGIANEDTTEMNLVEFETAMTRVCAFCKVQCVQIDDEVVFQVVGRGGNVKSGARAVADDGGVRAGGEGGGGDERLARGGDDESVGPGEEAQARKAKGDAAVQSAREKLKERDFAGARAARDDAAQLYALVGQDAHLIAAGNAAIAEVSALVFVCVRVCSCVCVCVCVCACVCVCVFVNVAHDWVYNLLVCIWVRACLFVHVYVCACVRVS